MDKYNIDYALELIENFFNEEYGTTLSQSDRNISKRIDLAYTTDEFDNEIQSFVNLEQLKVVQLVNGVIKKIRKYNTLKELIINELEYLNFDDLVCEY